MIPLSDKNNVYVLKTDPAVFRAVADGLKTNEIRFDDRGGYQPGDVLVLRETLNSAESMRDGAALAYSGRSLSVRVTHVLSGYGLVPGWVCLSFVVIADDGFDRYGAEVSIGKLSALVDDLRGELSAATSAKTKAKVDEWLACTFGMAGALLLATKFHPAFGFAAFLASNGWWIIFSIKAKLRGMLVQQIVFTLTSLIGLWNWWLGPLLLG